MADQKISQLPEKQVVVGADIVPILDSESNYANKKSPLSALAGLSAYTASAPLDITNKVISIAIADTTTDGAISATDWNTFNGKANIQAVDADTSSTTATLALEANKVYTFATALTALTISSIPSGTYETEIQFTTDSTFTFTASGLANRWIGISTPSFEANTKYIIAIKNGYAVLGKVGA